MFYIRTADRLQRTSTWFESLDGGLDHLRAVLFDDTLGLAAEMDADMASHVDVYECEWKATLDDPERLAHFVEFVNAPDVEHDAGVGHRAGTAGAGMTSLEIERIESPRTDAVGSCGRPRRRAPDRPWRRGARRRPPGRALPSVGRCDLRHRPHRTVHRMCRCSPAAWSARSATSPRCRRRCTSSDSISDTGRCLDDAAYAVGTWAVSVVDGVVTIGDRRPAAA